MPSRWADDEADAELEREREAEKKAKKRARTEKAQRLDAERLARDRKEAVAEPAAHRVNQDGGQSPGDRQNPVSDHARAFTSIEPVNQPARKTLLRHNAPGWYPSRNVSNFEKLNHIEEGSYGFVSRARDLTTGEVVALKKLKMDGSEQNGFPVTGLREIQCLMSAKHRHIVDLREIVVGDELNDVFLVMDFLEHDLKTLQEEMQEPFLPSEIKTLLLQLSSAVEYLHDHWILHRDLKTSNILMSNRGEIKVADFGMARYVGDPAPKLTQLVVTLWYRAPELLLGAEQYDAAIDMWSVGCIFGELLTKEPLLQGKNEVDQLSKTFELCGIPTDEIWPDFKRLPNARTLRLPRSEQAVGSVIRAKFPFLTSSGTALLSSLLSLNPAHRPTATEVLAHPYFVEAPRPKATSMFPTFPSKAGQEKRRRHASPSAPKRGEAPKLTEQGADFSGLFAARESEEAGAGFQLKLI